MAPEFANCGPGDTSMVKTPTNLGELEFAILEFIWEQGACSVKTAHKAVGQRRDSSHNTVQSAMKRLYEKKLLQRHKEGHAYIYRARIDRRGLTEMMIGQLVEDVTGTRIDVALQAFVDIADDTGDDTLAKLEELIARRREQQEE